MLKVFVKGDASKFEYYYILIPIECSHFYSLFCYITYSKAELITITITVTFTITFTDTITKPLLLTIFPNLNNKIERSRLTLILFVFYTFYSIKATCLIKYIFNIHIYLDIQNCGKEIFFFSFIF